MLEFLAKGGILVTPILLCSVLALAIFAERVIRFAILRKRGRQVAERVAAAVSAGDMTGARQAAGDSRSPMGRILSQGLDVGDQDQEILETILVHATETEVRTLSKYLQSLATIANIAPLLGPAGNGASA
jgi:biopolymer transport protein ExbB